jgi:hypothetical protein
MHMSSTGRYRPPLGVVPSSYCPLVAAAQRNRAVSSDAPSELPHLAFSKAAAGIAQGAVENDAEPWAAIVHSRGRMAGVCSQDPPKGDGTNSVHGLAYRLAKDKASLWQATKKPHENFGMPTVSINEQNVPICYGEKMRSTATLAKPAKKAKVRTAKVRATFHITEALFEAVRDAVVHMSGPPHRLTLARFAEGALRRELERFQKSENKGKPFPKRQSELQAGRPIGS